MLLPRRAALGLLASSVAIPLIISSLTGAEAYPVRSSKLRLRTTTTILLDPTSTTSSTTTSSTPSSTTNSTTSSTTGSSTSPSSGTAVDPTVVPAETRIAADWPFAATSPWNIGVGDGATFETATGTRTASLISTSYSAWVNADQYSHPIFKASESDPMATVSRAGYANVYYRIPNTAKPSGGNDMHMHVVEPNGRYIHESWKMQGTNPLWTTGYHVLTDMWGPGVGQGGVRAYGGSAIGGLIRKWEIDKGEVRHAIAIAITGTQLKSGYVWPATSQDGNASTSYSGQVPMGSFAAIPKSVDITTLGLSREGRILAKAMQDYGAYVVDRSSCFCLFADPSMAGTTSLSNMRADVAKIRAQLRVVANNGPTNVNGGGGRWVAPAPAFG